MAAAKGIAVLHQRESLGRIGYYPPTKTLSMKHLRYKKVKIVVDDLIGPSIQYIKRSRKRRTMPYKEIETILKIFFPRTKFHASDKGVFKHVFVIHSQKRRLALKIGRSTSHIRKDHRTYLSLPKDIRNRYFAKIYWADGLFMLQKYGRRTKVPRRVLVRLREVGRKYRLMDIHKGNVMKFGRGFKIVDAERRQ